WKSGRISSIRLANRQRMNIRKMMGKDWMTILFPQTKIGFPLIHAQGFANAGPCAYFFVMHVGYIVSFWGSTCLRQVDCIRWQIFENGLDLVNDGLCIAWC
ncbi:MAG TPA: hypothetical protein VHS96_12575, partial [Bacteroidia bacterium]|nr:hypothetical protein [Bacteroidia bacterium]